MSKKKWDFEINPKEIVEHLKEHHLVSFEDRRSLTYEDFISEHFNDDKGLMRYNARSNEYKKCKDRLRKSIKLCESEGIPLTQVWDINEHGNSELRFCKPNEEQVGYAKSKRYEKIVFGLLYKVENTLRMVEKRISLKQIVEVYSEWKRVKKKKKVLLKTNEN